MSGDFWTGFFAGLIMAMVFGLLYLGASPMVRSIRSPFRPQIVVHKTSKTPCRVVLEAIFAFFFMFFITLLILTVFIYLYRQGLFQSTF